MAIDVKWVALFSGQGAQKIEHAQRMRSSLPDDLREAWQRALANVGVGVDDLDDTTLTVNRVAQPTLCAWQVAAWDTLAAALPPPMLVAGYSVGEIAACCASGGYGGPQAIALAATRAACMDDATSAPSGLAAVLGLAERETDALCAREGVAIAIRNGKRHFVVGGPEAALAAFGTAALAAGATRVQRLAVATPAHTRWLDEAVRCFAAPLAATLTGALRIPLLSCIDARVLRTADDAVLALSRQIATPLDWALCMDTIAERGPSAVLEIGPGNALARMLTERMPELPARSLDDFRDPAAAVAWVARQRPGG